MSLACKYIKQPLIIRANIILDIPPLGLHRKRIKNAEKRWALYQDVKIGMFMDSFIYPISPAGLNNWVYIIVKTVYTVSSGVLTSGFIALSVVGGGSRR